MLADMEAHGKVTLTVGSESIELDGEDIQVRLQANEGWAAAQGRSSVVILSTELTPELIREGMSRDVVRLVQDRRKELNLQFTDRIQLWLEPENEELRQAIAENREHITAETLAVDLKLEAPSEKTDETVERNVADSVLRMTLQVTNA